AAGTDAATHQLRDELVVIVDPLMNPDGRERYLSQLEHLGGKVPNPDYQSMQHRGLWAAGRGNHYLFDLNRDWLMQVHPETRGRTAAMLEWNPHLVVDSHEMGGLSTYLFSPPREPINTFVSEKVRDWRRRFSVDQARAFDQRGWSYYTREWNEEWYVGYTNAWASLLGAPSILYEQAGVDGTSVMQEAGRALTYRESVQHHVVSSMTNLATLRANRRELLRDFAADRQWAVSGAGPYSETFLVPPMADRDRYHCFVDLMQRQGIETRLAEAPFEAKDAVDFWGERQAARTFPAGTLIIRSSQPHRRLLHAILAFDPRMSMEALVDERKKLERREGSQLYDVTAWNLPMAYGLDARWAGQVGEVASKPAWPLERAESRVVESERPYHYIIDSTDSSVYAFLVRLFDCNCKPRVAVEGFTLGSRKYKPGAVLLRRHENPEDLEDILREAAQGLTVDIVPAASTLSETGPDPGGERFKLLQPPRTAIASQWPVQPTSFGAAWYWLDARIGLRVSPINVQSLPSIDLRKYNVLVLPDIGGAASFAGVLGEEGVKRIKTWVQAGGTLIAIGGAAEFVAGKDRGLSAVRLRPDVLDQLPVYSETVAREAAARRIAIDPDAVWGTRPASAPSTQAAIPADTATRPAETKPDVEALKRADEWQRIFSPSGAILAATLDPEHWLCFGLEDRLPVLFGGSACYLATHPVRTPVRLMDRDHLRLSGLCWPEARERLAESAYATVESVGYGQIVMFAGDPTFRGYFEGPVRLFLSAVVLGPGLGTSTPLPW
ncbi:MAG: hypothetical protein HY718_11150, partial [Planctomycetes bacterium]|nr:hypothetical protein [Planctomycetota bacterium]